MKLTNKAGLPQPVFEALTNREYSKGDADISVTGLIDSPRVRVLKARHDHEIEVEAEMGLAAFMGTCLHKGIESGTRSGTSERRLTIEVEGWKVSGGTDHFDSGVITDYKSTNVFKAVYAKSGRVKSFEEQLNVYAEIHRQNGFLVSGLKIWMWFLDWRRNEFKEASRKNKLWVPNVRSGYPDHKWITYELPLWSSDIAKEFILKRVRLHQEAEKELPLCSTEDIWGGTRCGSYCEVAKHCLQYQNSIKTGLMQD